MSYLGPQLTGAANAIDNLGWNVSGYTNCVHTIYSASGTTYDVYSFSVAGSASITFTQSVANATMLVVGLAEVAVRLLVVAEAAGQLWRKRLQRSVTPMR